MNKKLIINIITASLILFITACEKVTPLNKNASSDLKLNNAKVYNQESEYASKLKKCILASKDTSCSLNELPLIRETSSEITKDNIKDRLIVSHKWMGDRFMEMLDIIQPDIKKLFGAVTAIVIDDDIHPAFYSTQTGAIYLDPRYLWLTPTEANTIVQKDDFRKDYGNDLKFIPAWRYVKSGSPAILGWDLSNPQPRTKDEIKINLERLLYHELSHANDFASKDVIDGANRDIPIVEAIGNRLDYTISAKLYDSMPLTDTTLKHLGQVLYMGSNSTIEDKTLTPRDVGALFDSDEANNMYNYATQYEDFAMLFEASMLKYHYNIDMDTGFVTNLKGDQHKCNDYILEWGARNRIAKSSIKPRVEFILNSIYPNKSNTWSYFLNSGIGEVTYLPVNKGWCDSINSSDIKYRKTNTQQVPSNDFLPPYL